jgi:hypothetical protein
MSRYLQNLQPNDWIEMMGPVGCMQHKHHITSEGLAAFAGDRKQVLRMF